MGPSKAAIKDNLSKNIASKQAQVLPWQYNGSFSWQKATFPDV